MGDENEEGEGTSGWALSRFQSKEAVGVDVEAELGGKLNPDCLVAVEWVLKALEPERTAMDLRVLKRRLLWLLVDKEGGRARRFLPEDLDRLRFYHSLHSAAALLSTSRASSETEKRFYLVQCRRILEELIKKLRVSADYVDLAQDVETSEWMAENMNEALFTSNCHSAMEEVEKAPLHPWSREPWDCHLDPDPDVAAIASSAKAAKAPTELKSINAHSRLQVHKSVSFDHSADSSNSKAP